MDIVAIFYGVICGGLAAVAPSFGRNVWFRVVIGAIIGVGAAFLLPTVRSMIGY